jgi:ferredoxin--NADP+ reductase
LPTPWGLVRSGVAPDHPKIRTVAKVFERVASESNFRLFANVELPRDLTVAQLQENYDAVVITTGACVGKKLGIPGEDLPGSISAAQFVPWYNGHPDFSELNFDFSNETAVVIGAGNVAMDCARILAVDPTELALTDIADHALAELMNSKIRTTHLVARRGPEHAAFTSPELRELPKLEHTKVLISAEELAAAHNRITAAGAPDKDVQSNLDAMAAVLQAPKEPERTLDFRFLLTPKEIHGTNRVTGITFSINSVDGGQVIASDETVTISCGLVISAIGYQSEVIPGLDYERGHLKNEGGKISSGLYTVGWAKRGPSGVIGTNKSDASEVVELLLSELGQPKPGKNIDALLPADHPVVSQDGWSAINQHEVAAGEAESRPRKKVVTWEKLLDLGVNG